MEDDAKKVNVSNIFVTVLIILNCSESYHLFVILHGLFNMLMKWEFLSGLVLPYQLKMS